VFVTGYRQEHHLFVVLGVHALVWLCIWLCVCLAVCAPDFGLTTQANIKAVMLACFLTQPMQHMHMLIAPEYIGQSAYDHVLWRPTCSACQEKLSLAWHALHLLATCPFFYIHSLLQVLLQSLSQQLLMMFLLVCALVYICQFS